MNNLIQWPKAKYWTAQWNPVIGCKPCSPACENCYAAAWAKRFGQSFEPHESSQERPPRKGVVFCGNMTDLFGEWVYHPHNNIGLVKSFANSGNATFLWLTKRVARMCDALTAFEFDDLSNHYFGFTAENQEWLDKRVVRMSKWPSWAKWWLSCEPLLGPIDLSDVLNNSNASDPRLLWVVVGCESGPNRRPCKIEWVESIVEQCLAANVPVFVKQLDINGKCEHDITKFPKHLQIRQVPWAKEGAK